MGLSEQFQTPAIFAAIQSSSSIEAVRDLIVQTGRNWFLEHPDQRSTIYKNAHSFGLPLDETFIEDFSYNLFLHYFEKLLPLFGGARELSDFVQKNIDCSDALACIKDQRSRGNGLLLAGAHFGAVELIVPALANNFIPVTPVLKFKTAGFSKAARERAQEMYKSGFFGEIDFVEIGKPDTIAALDMAAVLRRQECLLTMLDEKTDYSVPVTLLGKQVFGGAGLDRLVKFTRANVTVAFIAMVRTGDLSYRINIIPIDNCQEELAQKLATASEQVIKKNPEQWYFLHEEVSFVT